MTDDAFITTEELLEQFRKFGEDRFGIFTYSQQNDLLDFVLADVSPARLQEMLRWADTLKQNPMARGDK